LIPRQSSFNPLDFSIILGCYRPDSNKIFRLRRYNGKSHEHTNRIEGNPFYDFHIHTATERYQNLGMHEDSYAEPTESFSDFFSAMECMLKDCGFGALKAPQSLLIRPGKRLITFDDDNV